MRPPADPSPPAAASGGAAADSADAAPTGTAGAASSAAAGHRRFLVRVWQLSRPYWRSEEKLRAWGLLGASVALTLFLVLMDVVINLWQKSFYNALEAKDLAAFWRQLGYFGAIAAVYILAAVYQIYLQSMLQMRWRAWLTRHYTGIWLARNTFYRMELERHTDNPDQRIAEDIRNVTDMSLRLGLGLLNALVSMGSFVGILWMLSGPLEISLGGHAIGIPGYMVWAALLYAIAGSFITHYVGRRLILLSNQQQRREADFRYGLMQLRENAEGVALSRGGARESDASSRRFEDVRLNWWALMRCTKRLQFFTVGFAQLAVIFPFWVAAPRYFSGAFSLGQLMQIGSAFDSVRTALSWFVTSYATLAEWKASVDRLLQFTDTLDRASRAQAGPQLHIRSAPGTLDLSAQSLSVRLPDGRPLLEDARLDLHRGDRVVLSGASGSGKSTLFRVMAGIWPFAEGCLELPAAGQMLFLPQKPYIPAGPLRQALAYPAHPEQFEDAALREVLAAVRLGDLADRLDEHKPWMQVLSPGEQQRLAIARALLQKPQWLFLDEATAALDADNEQRMYALLTERLPQTAMLSIAHREQINPFHRRAWTIKDGALDPRADPLPGKA